MSTQNMKAGRFLTLAEGTIFYHKFDSGCFINFYTTERGIGIFLPSFRSEFADSEFHQKVESLLQAKKEEIRYKMIGEQALISKFGDIYQTYHWQKEKEVPRSGMTELFYDVENQKIRASKVDETVAPVTPLKKIQGKIKVMVVDDSKTIRDLLEKIFARDDSFEVIASIAHPKDVEASIKKLKPDVITLDIHMPEMNGVELLRKIFPIYKIPTVMISSISPEDGTYVLDALEIGAVDYIQKPEFSELAQAMPIIIEKVKTAATAKVIGQKSVGRNSISSLKMDQDHLIVIGSSTGGTEALKNILTRLPSEIPPILIVQHIPAVFSEAFAKRMNTLCPFTVSEAIDGDIVEAGHVYVAPGGKQMKLIKKAGVFSLSITDDAPVNRHKPSVDYLFDSVAALNPPKLVSVILTGMGGDGARCMKKLRDLGAATIAQNEESCVVFGMPREAIKLGGAEKVLHLDLIADEIVRAVSEKPKKVKASS